MTADDGVRSAFRDFPSHGSLIRPVSTCSCAHPKIALLRLPRARNRRLQAMVNAIQGSNLKQALSVALPQLAPWQPAAVALMAPDRPSLSFAGLASLVGDICGDL